MGTQSPSPKRGGAPSPIFGPFLLWPNGWRHQDATCMEVGLSPGDFAFDGDPGRPQKGAEPPIFGPCLLRPNGCMDQDPTSYKGRPWPRRHCVRWEPSSALPKKGAEPPPQFSAQVYCGQLLDGSRWHLAWRWALVQATFRYMMTQLPLHKKGTEHPNFRHISIVAKRLDASRCRLV